MGWPCGLPRSSRSACSLSSAFASPVDRCRSAGSGGAAARSGSARRCPRRRRASESHSLSLTAVSRPESPRKIFVAVAWPYASGLRHIGHVAGFGVPSDTFARYHRLRGNDVLMVSGTDEHGTPVMVAADAAGESPRETAERFNQLIRAGPPRSRSLVRPLHAHDDGQPLPRHPRSLPHALRQGLHHRARDARRVLRLDRPHAPRPLHRGHVPDLRLRERPWRPMRQLREPARPDRSDRPALEDRRDDAGVREDEAPLPRPAGVQGAAHRVDRVAGPLAPERQALLAQLRQGAEAARDHAGPRLGGADPGRGLRRAGRQADLRLVRRGHRLPLGRDRVGRGARRARRLARVVAEPGCRARVLHGEGQHRLPHRHLAEHAPRVRRRRRVRGRARATSSSPTTSSRASS